MDPNETNTGIDVSEIKKITLVMATDENGEAVCHEMFIEYDDGQIEKCLYDQSLCEEYYSSLPVEEIDDHFVAITENSDEYQELNETVERQELEEEEISDLDGEKRRKRRNALIAAGIIGGAGIAATVAGYVIQKNQDSKETQINNSVIGKDASFDQLMNALEKDHPRREFSQNVYDVAEKLNALAVDQDVFALSTDTYTNSDGTTATAKLEFTFDEVMAAKLVLNNYSTEELQAIFGQTEFDVQEILNNYESFAFKMTIYSMNGKAASGVSALIEDEANRTLFEEIESKIVDFNKRPTQENADILIRTFAYSYQHGINGTDRLENDEASLNGVKNLALNMMRGYADANSEEAYKGYLTVASAPGAIDNQYRSNQAAQVQKGETLSFYLEEAEKTCTIEGIADHLEEMNTQLTKTSLQDMISKEAKLELAEALFDDDQSDLAWSVLNSDSISPELEEAIGSSKKGKEVLEKYNNMTSAVESVSMDSIVAAANKSLGASSEIKDDVLYNNRIRGAEKVNNFSTSGMTQETWDSMSKEEQNAYVVANGTVQNVTSNTTEEIIQESDLTSSEKVEVADQKEQIQRLEEARYRGQEDASIYGSEAGAYKHAPIINNVNPDAPSEVPTSSLVGVVAAARAFNNETITSSDSQIQTRLQSDSSKFKSDFDANSKELAAYKEGWLDVIEQKLQTGIANGDILKSDAERMYAEALAAAQEAEQNQQNSVQEEQTPVISEDDYNVFPEIADSVDGFEDQYSDTGSYTAYAANDLMENDYDATLSAASSKSYSR